LLVSVSSVAAFMDKLTGSDITIAVTVYNREKYVRDAIRSALGQRATDRPKVIVVEDCGPNPKLREAITREFGESIAYFRNPRRRGLFDNWNACLELCQTPWLNILHDDDFLEPIFMEAMIELSQAAPRRALYYGLGDVISAEGKPIERRLRSPSFAWHELDLEEWACYDPVCFPAQLFSVSAARRLGGFRPTSRYCADWEMWFKLALNYGAAGTNRVVANYREHHSIGRGTSDVDISGRKNAYTNIQRKRHIAWLRKQRPELRFDRGELQKESPMPTRFILEHGRGFSPRMLRYNAGLLFLSSAPHIGYHLFQLAARLFSWRSLRAASAIFNFFRPRPRT
jgi:glycosyltransferase involved in cell wall biosynthesis